MTLSRRNFLGKILPLTAITGTILSPGCKTMEDEKIEPKEIEPFFKIFPVGVVEKKEGSSFIRIFDRFEDALLGLNEWSHVNVFYWFDRNDIPQKRRILRVNPRGNRKNPLTGVFACRAPVRPNLIALSVCKILSIQGNLVHVDTIDAFHETPVIDLKPFIPPDEPKKDVRVPEWTRRK